MAMSRLKTTNDAHLERPTAIRSESTSTSSADASASSADVADEIVDFIEVEDVSVRVESAVDGFPILTCSNGFVQYSGPLLAGTKLVDLMSGDTVKFQRWLHVCVNNILDNSSESLTTCQVKLGRRFAHNSRPAIEAECSVNLGKMMFEW